MNLVDQLLKADAKKADELNTGVFKSKRLAKILGKEEGETVDIGIREVKSRRINEIISSQYNSKGNLIFSKTYEAKIKVCIEGITDPDMRNKSLQEYYGVDDAPALVEKLFGNEVTAISDAISELSGISTDEDEDQEDEIKN